MGNLLWSALDSGIIVLRWKSSSFFVLSEWCRKRLVLGNAGYSFKVEISPFYLIFQCAVELC